MTPGQDGTRDHAATFRFHGDLDHLLVRKYRSPHITYHFLANPGIKDAVEAMGVPHTEVDVIVVNGHSVSFSYPLQHQDVVDVYPVQADVPLMRPLHLSPLPPEPIRFVLDVHLGTLARRLRLFGFDACYRNEFPDAEILRIALRDHRIILTRDSGLLKHRRVQHGYLVRSDQMVRQLLEVLQRYDLFRQVRLWSRCLKCNGLLDAVEKAVVLPELEPRTRLYYDVFHRCRSCGRIYWQGSHFENIDAWLRDFMTLAKTS